MSTSPRSNPNFDFPACAPDGYGGVIDWSGETGVFACYCGVQLGPYWSYGDTRNGGAKHHTATHPERVKVRPDCTDCGAKGAGIRRGVCADCRLQRIKAWTEVRRTEQKAWAEGLEPEDVWPDG